MKRIIVFLSVAAALALPRIVYAQTVVVPWTKLDVATSSTVATKVSDETGTGALVFANTPQLITPNIGAATGTSLTTTGNITGGNVTTAGNLTVTSNATVADVILGTSGPSVRSALNAKAPRGGVYFDGTTSSQVAATLTSQTIGTGDFSVVWVFTPRTTNPTAVEHVWTLTDGNAGSPYDDALCYYDTSGNLIFNFRLTGGSPIDAQRTASGFLATYGGKEVTCALVRSSGALTFYVNGVPQTLTGSSGSTAIALTGTYFAVGGITGATTPLVGTVSSATLYNYAVSSSRALWIAEHGGAVHPEDQFGTQTNRIANVSRNSNFSAGVTDWGAGAACTVSAASNSLSITTTGGSWYSSIDGLTQATTGGAFFTVGKRYRVSANVVTMSGVTAYFSAGAGTGVFGSVSGTGAYTAELTYTDPTWGRYFQINGTGTGTFTVDDVTLTQIGAVVHLPFTAGAGATAYDASTNGLNATLTSTGVAWTQPGKGFALGNVTAATSFVPTSSGGLTITPASGQSFLVSGVTQLYRGTGALDTLKIGQDVATAGNVGSVFNFDTTGNGTLKVTVKKDGTGFGTIALGTDGNGPVNVGGAGSTTTVGGNLTVSGTGAHSFTGEIQNAPTATNAVVRAKAPTTAYLSRFVAADNSGDAGYLDYDHSTDSWSIKTAGAERVTVSSGGNLTTSGTFTQGVASLSGSMIAGFKPTSGVQVSVHVDAPATNHATAGLDMTTHGASKFAGYGIGGRGVWALSSDSNVYVSSVGSGSVAFGSFAANPFTNVPASTAYTNFGVWDSGGITVGQATGGNRIVLQGGAGTSRPIYFASGLYNNSTGAGRRWGIMADGTAETGSSAGSNLIIAAYDDAGAPITPNPISITRSTGALSINGTSGAKGVRTATASIDFASMAASAADSQTMTITGVASGDTVIITTGDGSAYPDQITVYGFVSAANTVTLRAVNRSAGAYDPAAKVYRATVISF